MNEVYLSEYNKIKNVIKNNFRFSDETSEDILHDVYLKIQNREIEKSNSPEKYLYKVVYNTCLEYKRKRHIRPSGFIWIDDLENNINEVESIKDSFDLDSLLLNKQNYSKLKSIINNSKDNLSMTIIKEILSGKYNTVKELSIALNKNNNTVKHLIFLAIKKLNKEMNKLPVKEKQITNKVSRYKKVFNKEKISELNNKHTLSKELLTDIVKTKTIKDISKEYGLSRITVARYLKLYGIKVPKKIPDKIPKELLAKLIKIKSMSKISKEYGWSTNTIARYLKLYGIEKGTKIIPKIIIKKEELEHLIKNNSFDKLKQKFGWTITTIKRNLEMYGIHNERSKL